MAATQTASILRRLTLGPHPGDVEAFGDADAGAVVASVLDASAPDVDPPQVGADDFDEAPDWWLGRLRDPAGGLTERMVWFWHGHLTSSIDKSGAAAMVDQIQLIRQHARGNFRTLLREISTDAAMLWWLDGAFSTADAPNENYARELMELFALGRDSDAYTEADVRAGAVALAGWWIDEEDGDRVRFDPDSAPRRKVEFLGRSVRGVDEVIDAVCDHPACARHVAAALYTEFVGAPPSDARLDELAAEFRSSGLDIETLIRAIAEHPDFATSIVDRPRSALEWFLAFERLVDIEIEQWTLQEMGQRPMNPPNVAGWPGSERWTSSGMLLAKSQLAVNRAWDAPTLDDADPVGDVLRRAALIDVSDSTRAVLDDIASGTDDERGRRDLSTLLHATVALCPEFSRS